MAMWSADSDVFTATAKFILELVTNRSQRLAFDVSSANGILLFREASRLVVARGRATNDSFGSPLQWPF